jgi:hypothetical protein
MLHPACCMKQEEKRVAARETFPPLKRSARNASDL